jgi:hypothetical protein
MSIHSPSHVAEASRRWSCRFENLDELKPLKRERITVKDCKDATRKH